MRSRSREIYVFFLNFENAQMHLDKFILFVSAIPVPPESFFRDTKITYERFSYIRLLVCQPLNLRLAFNLK